MKIILDAMGGDNAPEEIIAGALKAVKEHGVKIVFVGDKEKISSFCQPDENIEIVHAPEIIEMTDSNPAKSIRKKPGASIVVASKLLSENKGDVLISAGNTGALMACGLLLVGRIKGIPRPGIAAIFPTIKGSSIVVDVGANVDSKPEHLVNYAVMGSIYANKVFGIEEPKVGLLSIGTEPGKGNELVAQTYELLAKSSINFIGNVEGFDIYKGTADVVVTDGFAGNILLKSSESLSDSLMYFIKKAMGEVGIEKEKMLKVFGKVKDFHTSNPKHSTAPLLGVSKGMFKCHGSSTGNTVCKAISIAKLFIENDLIENIKEKASINS